MKRVFTFILAFAGFAVQAQHTFSIVAVDTVTGEVGSAGASCVTGFPVRIIADVHPGVGAINTQAWYHINNKNYAKDLMNTGHSPQQIIDSLRANDKGTDGRDSSYRQYGAVDLYGTGARTAAHTGSNADNWKGHILGPNYSIQGNILLGAQILDSMEARFNNTPGDLAAKLMAALQGANVPGADTRCLSAGTPSTSSYIQVAKPWDTTGTLWLNLSVSPLSPGKNPIDSLQNMFDDWLIATGLPPDLAAPGVIISPSPSRDRIQILSSHLIESLVLTDVSGREMKRMANLRGGDSADISGLPSGLYFWQATGEDGLYLGSGKWMKLD